MDDKIFIRENAPAAEGRNLGQYAIIGFAVILIGAGLIGLVSTLGNNQADDQDQASDSELTTTVDTDEAETADAESNGADEDSSSSSDPATGTETPETGNGTDTDATTTNPTQSETGNNPDFEFEAPADESLYNVYFLQSGTTGSDPTNLRPVTREKPSSGNLLADIITEVLTGPSSAEQQAGYSKNWNFSGASSCSGGRTFSFSISGTTLTLEMCKEYSGPNPEFFKQSILLSMSEQANVSEVVILKPDGTNLV